MNAEVFMWELMNLGYEEVSFNSKGTRGMHFKVMSGDGYMEITLNEDEVLACKYSLLYSVQVSQEVYDWCNIPQAFVADGWADIKTPLVFDRMCW